MQRRRFNKVCGGLLAGAMLSAERQVHAITIRPASVLVESPGQPLALSAVGIDQAHVFHYPYVTTPCFLIRLDEQAREAAVSGSDTAGMSASAARAREAGLLAFSAICTHKMTHPAVPISHISYRADSVSYEPEQGQRVERSQVISCCSERSVYDVLDGGRVLSGPAPEPLARIVVELSSDGHIVATGSQGPNQYERFLDTFGVRLAMEHGVRNVRARAGRETLAVPANRFSHQQVHC